MGVSKILQESINKYIDKPCRIIELGNQCFYINGQEDKPTRDYYLVKGFDYVSIDMNGKNEAQQLDLCKQIYLKRADIVTNFGTSEHVENQYICFENIHNLCDLNGLIIHEVPETDSWKDHGIYTYTDAFFDMLRRFLNYTLVESKKHYYEGEGNLLFYVFKKDTENNFRHKVKIEVFNKYMYGI